LLETHGGVSEEDVLTVRAAGYDDAGIAELVAATAAQFYSNFMNRAIDTVVDFPDPGFPAKVVQA
jgi:alkylhydroperoxidase family enzyme